MDVYTIQKRLAENLKRIRKAHKLTQFQLAERAEVSEETIKNIELCRCWTSDKTLAQITDALQVDIYQFFLPVESDMEALADAEITQRFRQTLVNSIHTYMENILSELLEPAAPGAEADSC